MVFKSEKLKIFTDFIRISVIKTHGNIKISTVYIDWKFQYSFKLKSDHFLILTTQVK